MYDEFVEFIQNSDVKDKVDIKFIDVMEDSLDGYDAVKTMLEKGYGMPLTAVNGRLRFYGGISNEMFYEEIKKHL
ncbi:MULTISPECIES: hypothetical protein [Thermosediminibacter]|nr:MULTISPECIES: hypothetical protein [Thermosediminibacter]